jgi:hypothetical protein
MVEAEKALSESARTAGMAEMSAKFRAMGNQVYVDARKAEAAKTPAHAPGEAGSSREAVAASNRSLG